MFFFIKTLAWTGVPTGGCSFSYKRIYIYTHIIKTIYITTILLYITICIAISLVRSQQMVVEMPWLSPSKSPTGTRSVA